MKVTVPLERLNNSVTVSRKKEMTSHWARSLTGLVRFMTAGDVAVLGLVVCAALGLGMVLPGRVLSQGTLIDIRSGDKLIGRYALDRDRVVEVPGPRGITVVQISRGRARIVSSPCPKGICSHMGDIGSEGGMIACVPNEVVVQVSADREDGLDGVTR